MARIAASKLAGIFLVVLGVAAGAVFGWLLRNDEASRPAAAAAQTLAQAASPAFEATVANTAGPPGPAPDGMAWIPGGEFSMGCPAEADSLCCRRGVVRDAGPVHRVRVDGFWMDRTEVTNARYRACVLDGACAPSLSREDDPRTAAPDMPVVGVSALDAERFCAWAGGRLPTEARRHP